MRLIVSIGAGLLVVACAAAVPAPAERTGSRVERHTAAPTNQVDPAIAAPPPAPAAPASPRRFALGANVRIYVRPDLEGRFLGHVRLGHSVELVSEEHHAGKASVASGGPRTQTPGGCPAGFLAVLPRGFVCDDDDVARDPPPRWSTAAALVAPASGPLPFRYGVSNGTPTYGSVPSREAQQRAERAFGPAGAHARLRGLSAVHEDLAREVSIAPDPASSVDLRALFAHAILEPDELLREAAPAGSMVSFSRAFEAEGRTWLVSPDLSLVPADRVRPFVPSVFHGVELRADVHLPAAWVRGRARAKLGPREGGGFEQTGGTWPPRTLVPLASEAVRAQGSVAVLETTERDAGGRPVFVRARDVVVVTAASRLPFGVEAGRKWIHVSISRATLVAYEGLVPVFTTLVSPGIGGIPTPGEDPVKNSTTPLGVYAITYKDRAATMAPLREDDEEERRFFAADVPSTLYFAPPFAIHAATWHDRFGEPASAGCVNVSPVDAERLFGWSDPPLPAGWDGVTGATAPENGPRTWVVVTR